MAKRQSWYDKGFAEALAGMSADPPWNPGHRDYTSYMEGHGDGEEQARRDANRRPNEDEDD